MCVGGWGGAPSPPGSAPGGLWAGRRLGRGRGSDKRGEDNIQRTFVHAGAPSSLSPRTAPWAAPPLSSGAAGPLGGQASTSWRPQPRSRRRPHPGTSEGKDPRGWGSQSLGTVPVSWRQGPPPPGTRPSSRGSEGGTAPWSQPASQAYSSPGCRDGSSTPFGVGVPRCRGKQGLARGPGPFSGPRRAGRGGAGRGGAVTPPTCPPARHISTVFARGWFLGLGCPEQGVTVSRPPASTVGWPPARPPDAQGSEASRCSEPTGPREQLVTGTPRGV